MIVVAEGAASAQEVSQMLREDLCLDPRITVLGHIQRGGSPTARDRVAATKMGYLAVDLLRAGKTNRIVCTHEGGFTDIDMDEGLAATKKMQQMEMDVLDAMTGL
jgi:6-phosphofructokinase 1